MLAWEKVHWEILQRYWRKRYDGLEREDMENSKEMVHKMPECKMNKSDVIEWIVADGSKQHMKQLMVTNGIGKVTAGKGFNALEVQ